MRHRARIEGDVLRILKGDGSRALTVVGVEADGRHGEIAVLDGQSPKSYVLQIRCYQYLLELGHDHTVVVGVLAGAGEISERPGRGRPVQEPLARLRELVLNVFDDVAMLGNEADRVGDTRIDDRGARKVDDVFSGIHATDALPSDVEFFKNHQLDVASERGVPCGLAASVPRRRRQILPGIGHGIRGIVEEAIKTLPARPASVNRAVRFGSRGRRSGRIQIDRIRHPKIGAEISAQTRA